MKHSARGVMAFGILLAGLSGCAGQGEAVPINLGLKPSGTSAPPAHASPVTVLVMPFSDDRSDRTKIGMHQTLWGTTEPLTVKQGSIGEATAKELADYLVRKGWRARYVSGGSAADSDVVISGKVLESSVDAHGTMGSTDIAAKHKIVVHAQNHSDGSSITDTVSHNGTYRVFWYAPEDAEEILNEVMEKNFEKFLSQTRFEGQALRFK